MSNEIVRLNDPILFRTFTILVLFFDLRLLQLDVQPNMSASIESMTRYVSPVNPAIYPHLTLVLLSIGVFFMAWFLVYEVTANKYTRDFYKELLVALVASLFMGFGVLFLLLWVGIYV